MSAPTIMMVGVKARIVTRMLIMVYPFMWVYVGKCGKMWDLDLFLVTWYPPFDRRTILVFSKVRKDSSDVGEGTG